MQRRSYDLYQEGRNVAASGRLGNVRMVRGWWLNTYVRSTKATKIEGAYVSRLSLSPMSTVYGNTVVSSLRWQIANGYYESTLQQEYGILPPFLLEGLPRIPMPHSPYRNLLGCAFGGSVQNRQSVG